ncbi:T9SS type A sorting domain-containing protein [bacterium]|nr:T9SS type A sorting domain-containing protein [bacterium]
MCSTWYHSGSKILVALLALACLAGLAQAELIGDSLHVGYTWLDTPQPISSPNNLVYQEVDEDSAVVSLLWFEQTGADSLPRAVQWSITYPEGVWDLEMNRTPVDPTTAFSVGGVNLPPLNGTNSVYMLNRRADFLSLPPTPSIALDWGNADYDFEAFWGYSEEVSAFNSPHAVYQGGAEDTLHSIYTCLAEPDDETMTLYYSKWYYNPFVSQTFFEMIDVDDPPIITDGIRQTASDIAISDDGTHLAIAALVARDEETGDRDQIRAVNNDLLLFESFDGGITWNSDSPTDVTNWIGGDGTTDPDTLRCVSDAHVLIDANDVVHVLFTVASVFVEQNTTTPESRIFHWDSDTHLYTQVADGVSNASGLLNADGHTVSHPVAVHQSFDNLAVLWVAYLGISDLDHHETPGDEANGYACNDVWLSMSTNNGLGWTAPVNLTRTNGFGGDDPQPGDAQSETWLSMTEQGGYDWFFQNFLLFSYIKDTWPGDEVEGAINEIVFHQVHTGELYDIMARRTEEGTWDGLQRNYPLHVDSTGFYEGMIVLPTSAPEPVHPVEFKLDPVYPNPFNPSTRISFALGSRQAVRLTVYDVLGREVAVLLDRPMKAGEHTVAFSGTDLPSGMYFCKLQVADQTQMQKMVLMQ